MKNINVPISDDLISRMKELKIFCNANWSAISRGCIEQYMKRRAANSIYEEIKGKDKDFKSGFYFLIRSIDDFDLKTIEDIANNIIVDNDKNEEFNKGMIYAAKELLFRSR
jgi:hypothetical protein